MSRRILGCLTAVVLMSFLVAACADLPPAADFDVASTEAPILDAKPQAVPTVAVVAEFNPAAGEFPEGIAIDRRGTLFVSITPLGQIWRNNGGWSLFASVPLSEGDFGVIGLAFDRQDVLHACVVTGDPNTNGVWRFDASGTGQHIAGTEGIAFCNAITFDNRGLMYVSDTIAGAVWRSNRDGSVEPWITHPSLLGDGSFGLGIPIGANGLLFSTHHNQRGTIGTLLVAVTEAARLVGIPVRPGGDPGDPYTIVEDAGLYGIDGIVEGERGKIYGAVNIQNTVVRIDRPTGEFSVVADSYLDFPASLAWGRAGRDVHALYVTNFALANEEDPAPGVARIDLGPPGRR